MKKNIIKLNDIKNANLLAVLKILLQHDGLSRIEIAQQMGCDNTTVSRAVGELLSREIIIHGRKNEVPHGRPRITLQINPAGPLLLGIALNSDRITGVLTDLKGSVQQEITYRFAQAPAQTDFLEGLGEVISPLTGSAGPRLLGCGVAGFGSYTGEDFVLENVAALPTLNGLALKPVLRDMLGMSPVIGDHLAAKFCYLKRHCPELEQKTALLVSIGNGIGLAASENGRMLFAPNNHGGEFGHNIYVPDGMQCSCGRRGCLETVASVPALLREVQSKLALKKLTLAEVRKYLDSGDRRVEACVKHATDYLATAIANQLNNFPVDNLLVTGRMLELGEWFTGYLETAVRHNIFNSVALALTIDFAPEGQNNFLARGAALMAAETAVTRAITGDPDQ